jgi:hypothetical protein
VCVRRGVRGTRQTSRRLQGLGRLDAGVCGRGAMSVVLCAWDCLRGYVCGWCCVRAATYLCAPPAPAEAPPGVANAFIRSIEVTMDTLLRKLQRHEHHPHKHGTHPQVTLQQARAHVRVWLGGCRRAETA